jgi:aspartate/tyrosine/aromatic aminotransferase
MIFDNVEMAPPDPILGLSAALKEDPNPEKIDLGAGIYRDESGKTPVFSAVRKAERKILERAQSKEYLPQQGAADYAAAVQEMLLGQGHEALASQRAATVQSLGGTGGLRLAGEFIRKIRPGGRLWVSEPTWSNHYGVFGATGVEIKTYPYYDEAGKRLDFEPMIQALGGIPEGDAVLLHGCCHNPSGMDPTPQQWARIAEVSARQGFLPLIDFAYQGFGQGIEEDATGARMFCAPGREAVIVSSFSKNFGLYNERIGALTVLCSSAEAARRVLSQLQIVIRQNYSNPPSHGSAIVAAILGDPQLRREWEEELAVTRGRIQEMRRLFVETLKAKGVERDFSFIVRQNGMFSFSGLTKEQVAELKAKDSIYIVGSGRINVAGMTPANVDRLCEAIARVLG